MKLIYNVDWIKKWAKGSLKMKRQKRVELGFWFWVICGELMKWSFVNENWRSNGWIMIWMIDFNKKMSQRWRNLREKWWSTIHVWERERNKWRTSEEMMIEKCLIKVKYMGNGLKDLILPWKRVSNEEILSGNRGDMFGFERKWKEVEEHMKKRREIS